MRRHIATKLVRNLLCATLLVVSFMAVRAVLGDTVATQRDSVVTLSETPPVERLVSAHDCWTGNAPEDMHGVVPGHVVVTRRGQLHYAGARMVARALEQIFEGVDHGLTVHAFCR